MVALSIEYCFAMGRGRSIQSKTISYCKCYAKLVNILKQDLNGGPREKNQLHEGQPYLKELNCPNDNSV